MSPKVCVTWHNAGKVIQNQANFRVGITLDMSISFCLFPVSSHWVTNVMWFLVEYGLMDFVTCWKSHKTSSTYFSLRGSVTIF